MDSPAVFLIPAVALLAVLGIAWHFGRSRSLLDRWAAEHGYEVLRAEYRSFFKGPFFWNSSKGQTVYRVTIEDEDGRVLSGWVRCGGWWLGLMSDHVEVRWDEPVPMKPHPMRDRW